MNKKAELEVQSPRFAYEEPQYGYVPEEVQYIVTESQEDLVDEELPLPIYSPQQLLMKKSAVPDMMHDGYEFHLDSQVRDPNPRSKTNQNKKVCVQKHDDSTTLDQSESYPVQEYECEGDLERLAHMITQETQKKFSFPKSIPLPSREIVEQHLLDLKMRFPGTQKQEDFLGQYIQSQDLMRLKLGLNEEILNDAETMKFEDWVDNLCNSSNHESLKEMARRQKVKRYLEKKHNRTYEKKVHYHIRQKVAEERLRVKGRFVTWTQALKMLNETQETKKWSYNDYFKIKSLLNEKFGAIKSERSLRH